MYRALLIRLGLVVIALAGMGVTLFSLPTLLAVSANYEQKQAFSLMQEDFPVTVNPQKKTITEDALVNAYLESDDSPLQAAAGNVWNIFGDAFALVASSIANAPWYTSIAAASERIVYITPGMRKEQVVNAFAEALDWDAKEKKEFLSIAPPATLPFLEGSFSPGVYLVPHDATVRAAHALVQERFAQEILSRYSAETARIVPLRQALTIASLIEREAGGADDMRLISGVIWNRLFIDMNLQIDATLQYVKADSAGAKSWWPGVVPEDRFRKSPHNTYLNKGLPPTPIANPSVASVLAALNPKSTSCLFYFHDATRRFYCTDTYADHVALLKKHYGRGK